MIVPTEKQCEALQCTANEVLFGGARGGGKTEAGIMGYLYFITNPLFRGLTIRRNSNDLSDWIDRARALFTKIDPGLTVTGQQAEFRFSTGALIRTGHLKDSDAYEKYQGHEYHRITIEELTHIPREEDYVKLISSCRSTEPSLKPQVFCTTNPGNAGHEWVKRRFVIPTDYGKNIHKVVNNARTRTIAYVPATVFDNKHLVNNDPDYVAYLESLTGTLKKQWLEGSWDEYEVEGAYYTLELREAKDRIGHVEYDDERTVDTFWDLGVSDQTCIWYAQRVGQQIHIIDYDEFQNTGLREIARCVHDKPYVYGHHVAPHDANKRMLDEKASTPAIIARKLGINFYVLPIQSVESGIEASRLMFGRYHFNNCELGLRRLKNYRKEYKEKLQLWKPLHDINSHGADAFRYMSQFYLTGEPPQEHVTPQFIANLKKRYVNQ